MRRVILLIASSYLLVACQKEQMAEFTDIPIVEGYLYAGKPITLKITRQIPFSENVEYSSEDLSSLDITVTYNSSPFVLQSLGGGYYTNENIIANEGTEYVLKFKYDNKDVTAFTYVPSKPTEFSASSYTLQIERRDTLTGSPGSFSMPEPITLSWKNTDAGYYLVLIENLESTLDPIRDFGGNAPPGNIFRKQPTNSSKEEVRSQEFQYYGTHRIVLYHVLPDYASMYTQSANSSQNLTNPSTSIENGYGIFTGLSSDTLYVEVIE